MWRRKPTDIFLIEISHRKDSNHHSMLDYLPRIDFQTPVRYLYDLRNQNDEEIVDGMNTESTAKMFQDWYRNEK